MDLEDRELVVGHEVVVVVVREMAGGVRAFVELVGPRRGGRGIEGCASDRA